MERCGESLEYTVLLDTLLYVIIDDGNRATTTTNNIDTHTTNISSTEIILFHIFNIQKTEFLAKIIKTKFHCIT